MPAKSLPKPPLRLVALLAILSAGIWYLASRGHVSLAQDMDPAMNINAPQFPADFAWLNTDTPLQFRQDGPSVAGGSPGGLKGQVVLLDFWTYCCINCMHVLPDLAYLEDKFKNDPFIVIGVHSAKFENEGSLPNVRSAVQRYNVHHPVIVDEKMGLWNAFAVNSWPTIVLVGPDGKILGAVSGEGNRDLLEKAVARALKDARAAGTLAAAPLQLKKEGMVQSASGLAFPSKVIPDAANNRLFVLDSNHNRILITTWPNSQARTSLLSIIGTGKPGQADGPFNQAEFYRPQGATLAGNLLYVADTENHLIRRVDLKTNTVTTVLGTGKQVYDREGGKSGRDQPLNSPWDVAINGTKLYISMAGQHQLFVANTLTWMAEPLAGSGREDIADGPAHDANLAQPSGLAFDAATSRLYFADSEVSAVRYVDLKTNTVQTIIGHGLFDFGDIEGNSETARFQHPLGVAVFGDKLLVADTYNHRIRLVDPNARLSQTFLGTGQPGAGDAGAELGLYEPENVSVAENNSGEIVGKEGAKDGKSELNGGQKWVFIADTDNHRIVVLDAQTKAWQQLMIDGLDQTAARKITDPTLPAESVEVPSNQALTFHFRPKLPVGKHLTAGAPLSVELLLSTDAEDKPFSQQTLTDVSHLPISLTVPADVVASALKPDQNATWLVRLDYTFCSDGPGAVCTPRRVIWKLPVKAQANGNKEVTLRE